MANCNNLFQTFHSEIQILPSKKEKLGKSKDRLRKRIIEYFKENHPDYEPKFFIQGSYKMGTAVRTKDDTCDLDDGVYFLRLPDHEATTLQKWVRDAVDGHTDEQQHRKKCISVIYKKEGVEDFNIDIPVYYKLDNEAPHLAVKDEGWQESDPKAFVEWFRGKKKKKGQIVKIVRFLKMWCDHVRDKMPNGLAMTVLACNTLEDATFESSRDDATLRNVLKQIRKNLKVKWECVVPVVPNDDLFKNYDEDRKTKFFNRLEGFIEDADKALNEKNQLKASRLWQKHLGSKYFPDGEDKDEEENVENVAGLASVVGNKKPWRS